MRFVTWLSLLLSVPLAHAAPWREPNGFYVMQAVHNQNINNSTLQSPALEGIHIRDEWQLLEPTRNTWDFNFYDTQIARAKDFGKKVTLGLYAGNNSPSWLGAPLDSGCPLPWSPGVEDRFLEAVNALGSRYNEETAITAVHISSVVTADSMEMFYPQGLKNRSDYTDDKVVAIWSRAIDAFADAFPDNTLVLDISMVPDSNGSVTYRVMNYARTRLWDRVNFIMCSLKASTDPQAPHYLAVKNAHQADDSVRIGFEMVGPSTDSVRFGGPFTTALALGQKTGATWYQIYQADISKIPLNFFSVPGDYDHNGVTNQSDYNLWRSSFGKDDMRADGNDDGKVDMADYVIWRSFVGSINNQTLNTRIIPEPSSLTLALLAILLLFSRRGR